MGTDARAVRRDLATAVTAGAAAFVCHDARLAETASSDPPFALDVKLDTMVTWGHIASLSTGETFIDEQAAQRGYCINGRIMTAKAFCPCTPGVWS